MANLNIDIPNNLYSLLQASFLKSDPIIAGFAVAALQEYGNWLGGQDRPSTMSELETKRIFFVYDNILKNKVPSIREIGELFNLPLGRARYIVQNLNYRYPIFMQQRKTDVAKLALNNYQVSPVGTHIVTCPIECHDVIENAIAQLKIAGTLTANPSRQFYPFDVVYEMSPNDRLSILNQIP